MPGYFTDGTIDVELGAHVFCQPSTQRRNVLLAPPNLPAVALPSGGGRMSVDVTGQRLRTNLGDAERYVYELLSALATSGAGDLGVEDTRGQQSVFDDAICVDAVGEVRAFRFADMRFGFLCPEKSSEPAYAGAPSAPSLYAGSSTLQDYRLLGGPDCTGGTPYGMRIEMTRTWDLREVPRARGARVTSVPAGAQIRFVVRLRPASSGERAGDVRDYIEAVGAGQYDLAAKGHVYYGVVLDMTRAELTFLRAGDFELEFVQEVGNGAAQVTTAAPTTTTTIGA